MTPGTKNQIMKDFSKGIIDILVSTTVVEVGVNVPNATIMIIENAERFGLAQLHQLRGRVGRGEHASHCVLISDTKSTHTKKRLEKLKDTSDGFLIADYDLKTTGPRDRFGTMQHGMPNFRLGDIYEHIDILKVTANLVKEIQILDPTLDSHTYSVLKNQINQFYLTCSENMTL